MELEAVIRQSERSIQGIDRQIDGLEIPNSLRNRLAGGCLEMALEHQKAIVLLVANKLHGSALSLVRILFEAYVRGVWLHRCASHAELERFEKDQLEKRFGELLHEVEKLEGFEARLLSDIKNRSWKVMNSFTHTGFHQVVRRQTEDTIESTYDIHELVQLIDFADALGFMSAVEIAVVGDNVKLANDVFSEMRRRWPERLEHLSNIVEPK